MDSSAYHYPLYHHHGAPKALFFSLWYCQVSCLIWMLDPDTPSVRTDDNSLVLLPGTGIPFLHLHSQPQATQKPSAPTDTALPLPRSCLHHPHPTCASLTLPCPPWHHNPSACTLLSQKLLKRHIGHSLASHQRPSMASQCLRVKSTLWVAVQVFHASPLSWPLPPLRPSRCS